jgi:hypothetical protein
MRLLGAGLCGAAALACLGIGGAALVRGQWQGVWVILVGALWGLGVVMVLDLHEQLLRRLPSGGRNEVLGGAVALLAGSVLLVQTVTTGGAASIGLAVAAASVFLLVGVLLLASGLGWLAGDGLVRRLLVAVLLSVFTAIAMLFPPGALIVAVFAASAWIAVYRRIHERATGCDPMAGLSDAKQLGVAALVVLVLLLTAGGIWVVGKRTREKGPAAVEAAAPAAPAAATAAEAAAGATPAEGLPLEALPSEAPPSPLLPAEAP